MKDLLDEILDSARVHAPDADEIRLIELDSVLVAELHAALEEAAGRPLERDAFPIADTTIGDLYRFAAQLDVGAHQKG